VTSASDLTLSGPDKLAIEVFSFADLEFEDRLRRVWRAFDSHPDLRPLKIGPSDPPRIKVGNSMEQALEGRPLPFPWWLMARHTKPVYEGGDLKLYLGRGGFFRDHKGAGHWLAHTVAMAWSADWMRDNHAEEGAAQLFEALCDATAACYGMAYQVHQAGQWMSWFPKRSRTGAGDLERELRDVFWINWFGPAFVERFPGLLTVDGAEAKPSGAALVRTTDSPWMYEPDAGSPDAYAWKRPLYEVLGRDSFATPGVDATLKPLGHLPTRLQHMARASGTKELPEERWEREIAARDLAKDLERRQRRFARAKAMLESAGAAKAPTLGRAEFSVALDAGDVKAVWGRLRRRYRGDLAGDRGKALLSAIMNAPLDSEEHYELQLDGPLGPELVRIGWFMDDIESPDLYFFGSDALAAELGGMFEDD